MGGHHDVAYADEPLLHLATQRTLAIMRASTRLQTEFGLFVPTASLQSRRFCEELVPLVVQPLVEAAPASDAATFAAAPSSGDVLGGGSGSPLLTRLFRLCELLGVSRSVCRWCLDGCASAEDVFHQCNIGRRWGVNTTSRVSVSLANLSWA